MAIISFLIFSLSWFTSWSLRLSMLTSSLSSALGGGYFLKGEACSRSCDLARFRAALTGLDVCFRWSSLSSKVPIWAQMCV